jgi:hypothetical protein
MSGNKRSRIFFLGLTCSTHRERYKRQLSDRFVKNEIKVSRQALQDLVLGVRLQHTQGKVPAAIEQPYIEKEGTSHPPNH